MLLKNITHLFFPTEMHSNALGDKCTAEVQRCETVCNITFSETFSRVDFQKFIQPPSVRNSRSENLIDLHGQEYISAVAR